MFDLTVISQQPFEALPGDLRQRVAGHWRVDDALDPAQLVAAARSLGNRFGQPLQLIGVLEQLQVPLAVAREALELPGLSVDASRNFRDKSRMKTVLAEAGLPCARHSLAGDADTARRFAADVGFPLVVKPPAGAGSVGTYRIDDEAALERFIAAHPHVEAHPALYEEFVAGEEYSFDSVCIDGEMVWHSVSHYRPPPLVVLENPWIQWVVYLPRDISGEAFDPIRDAAERAVTTLGLHTGLSHMEWFRLSESRIAISEVGARPPGAQITSLLSYAHDHDFFAAWPKLMVTGEFDVPERKFAAGAAYVRAQGQGRIRHIHGLGEAQRRYGDLVVEAQLPKPGQGTRDGYEGDGFVIVRHPESAVVEEALNGIVELIQVELV